MTLRIAITDTRTGECVEAEEPGPWDESMDYLWSEGNFGCDCNRELFFERAKRKEPDWHGSDRPCGDTRYRVRITDAESGAELYDDDHRSGA